MPAQWMKTYINNGDERLNGSLLLTLLALAYNADTGGFLMPPPSEALIAKQTRLGVEQVSVDLEKLGDLGYLFRYRGVGSTWRYYFLNDPEVPKDGQTDKEGKQI
jgi:hypothetical protein